MSNKLFLHIFLSFTFIFAKLWPFKCWPKYFEKHRPYFLEIFKSLTYNKIYVLSKFTFHLNIKVIVKNKTIDKENIAKNNL